MTLRLSAIRLSFLLQVVKSYQSGKKEGGDFVASWLSPRGAYLYCLGEDGNVFCFETAGKLESVLEVGPSSCYETIILLAACQQELESTGYCHVAPTRTAWRKRQGPLFFDRGKLESTLQAGTLH